MQNERILFRRSHTTTTRVRYSETDRMGVVYYGNYAAFYEIGRVEFLRSLGIRYRDLEDIHQLALAVVSMETKYVRPAVYDDLLTIETTLQHLEGKYVVFFTELRNEAGRILNTGRIKLCFVDRQTFTSVAIPAFFTNAITQAFDQSMDQI